MPPLSEKKKASNAKWDARNLKRMSLAVPVEMYDRMQGHVALTKETVNGFIKRAISETIDRDDEARNKCNGIVDDVASDMQSRAAEVLDAVDAEAEDSTGNIGIPNTDIGIPMSDNEKSFDDADALPWAEDDKPVKHRESWSEVVARHLKDVPPSMN